MVSARSAPRTALPLPRVLTATLLVAVLPSLLVSGLLGAGLTSSPVLSIPLATVVSLSICQLCTFYWERYRASEDVLFGDLMIWGWVKRRLTERRLANATSLFGLTDSQPRTTPSTGSAAQRINLLQGLATDLEASDPYTHGHSRRVARYASLIASQLGLPAAEVATIRTAAALHDVGKIHTPIAVLHKTERLTDEEFAVIKRHPVDGARMIGLQVQDPELEAIVLHHHERLDGTGYPGRISGTEIPIGARIIAVADTFDAITSKRPYRPAKPHKIALDILRAESGTQLDPDAVRAFRSVYYSRPPVGALAALASLGERGLAWLLAGGVNAARVAGVAAATALGSAALAPSALPRLPAGIPAVAPSASARLPVLFHIARTRVEPRRGPASRRPGSRTSSVPSSGSASRAPLSVPRGAAGSGPGQTAPTTTGGSASTSPPSPPARRAPTAGATAPPVSSAPRTVGATVNGGAGPCRGRGGSERIRSCGGLRPFEQQHAADRSVVGQPVAEVDARPLMRSAQ
jgi:putative nucleotidyltransferase with HDIG domain